MPEMEAPDDPTIPDDAVLWRRVPPYHVIDDQGLGRKRPTSAAFCDSPDGSPMSAALAAACPGPQDALAGHEGFSLVAFTAGFARSQGLWIIRDPQPGEPWHVLVAGKKTKKVRKQFGATVTWVVQPDPEPPEPTC